MDLFKKSILSLQILFSCFGATILVGILCGIPISLCLFGAGVGTLIFHALTKGRIPVFLGSSFAFIAVISTIGAKYGLSYAMGGVVVAGICYCLYSLIAYLIGSKKLLKLFPPVVRGSMIFVIGATLLPTVVQANLINSQVGSPIQKLIIAFVILGVMIAVSIYCKGFFKLIPILFAIIVGYIACMIMGIVDFTAVSQAPILEIPKFMLPQFNIEAMVLIGTTSLVSFLEHLGDIATISAVCEEDFIEDIGLHRTLLGDGVATMFAGMLGCPANTTYSEGTSVIAITKQKDPSIVRLSAIFAIMLAFFGKFTALIGTMPQPIIGSISIMLFGTIIVVGIMQLQKVDFSKTKNVIICAIMISFGIAGFMLPIGSISLSGLPLSALFGIILNLALKDS